MDHDLKTIPVIDYLLLERGQKDQLLAQLRYAFIIVGFCYLKNPPIDKVSRLGGKWPMRYIVSSLHQHPLINVGIDSTNCRICTTDL